MKKLILFLFTITIASCGSSKIRTTKQNTVTSYPVKKRTNTTNTSKPSNKKNSEILIATSKVKATTEDVKNYISTYKETAKANMKSFGIPASIIMAQAILESGAGFGSLCKEANNHFGIKCHSDWTGESVKYDDDAAQECFRKYKEATESFKDHSLFLKRKRYESLFQIDKGDYESWANGLKQAGYATDTLYPTKLIGLIERYELYKLDNEVLARNFIPKTKEISSSNSEHIVQIGETLYSISKKYNISVEELKSINNIQENNINVDQKLKIKK